MYAKLARELAFYEYMRSDCQRLHADREKVEYWDAKYHGLARGIEIVTGFYPIAICHGDSVEVHIGNYQAIKYFG